LRQHGLVRRIARKFKYYLSQAGLSALIAAEKLRHHLIIPTLNAATWPRNLRASCNHFLN